jgi:proton-translocating NAD(P)+ transhydrogenase subunit alpha
MAAARVGVLRESAAGERRVAMTPDVVSRLRNAGVEVLVETGAGDRAWYPDDDYAQAGASIVDSASVREVADVLLCVQAPPAGQIRDGQTVIGLLGPLLEPELMRDLAARKITAISLDGLPRTLTRVQTMDALTSQASVAGYRAVLVAANHFDRFFPLLITAAGTSKPAGVLVLGAGVAGLQAIGTARRLGAVVSAYDVRPAARSEVASLGAKFIELTSVESGGGEGGYARILTEEEQAAIQAELAEHIARHDIVITTAQVPGQVPPLMVTAATVKAMRPGSVIVDLAASELGGNVEGSRPDETLVTTNGVTIVGAPNLPSAMANAASAAYARNITALFLYIVHDGEVVIDTSDEVQRGVVVTYGGEVVHPAVRALLDLPPNGPRADPDDDSGLSGHHGVVGPDTGPVS